MSSLEHLTLGPQEPTITSEMETTQGHQADEMQKLAEYLRTLREERGKVEAFKRELPLCMQLIDEAIATAKQRAMEDQCSPTASLQTTILDAEISDSEKSKGPESFMPLKRRWNKQQKDKSGQGEVSQDSEQHHKVVLGRPAWTEKVQQSTQQSDCTVYEKASSSRSTKRYADFGGSEQARSPLTSSRLHLSSDHRQRGAFVPFIRERQLNSPILSQPTEAVPDAAPELRVTPAVRSAGQNVQISRGFDVDVNVQGREYHSSDARMSTDISGQTRTSVSQQQRKARRCWSPELHRRFVSALQQLGGSQVATPKQIRELMKVDSLTNDEVKSHLQKYRLHTRRPSPSPSSPSPHAPQLVVLGWMRPDQFKAAVGAASQASTGGVCDDPPLVIAQKYIPPQSTEQPQMQPLPVLQKHQPAISTSQTSLRGPSVIGGSPNSSSESYLDEGDDVQERTSMSSGQTERQLEGNEQQLQSAIESKGSTTSLVDIGIDTTQNRDCNSSHVKLHTSRKTKAAA